MNALYWGVEFFASFVQTLMCYIFCGTFVIKESLYEYRYKIAIMSLIGAMVIIGFNTIALFSYVSNLVFIFMLWITQLFIFKKKVVFQLLLSVIYFCILASFNFVTTYIIAAIGGISTEQLILEQSVFRLYNIFLSITLLSLLIVSINKFVNGSKILPKSHITLMFIGSSFLLISNFVRMESETSDEVNMFSVIFYFGSLIMIVLLFFLIIRLAGNYEQLQKMNLIEMKNEMLQKSLDDTEQTFNLWKKSVHDYKNNILALSNLAEENNTEAIRDFLKKETELINNKIFYTRTGNSIVDTIVNTKQNIAIQKNIVFVVNAFIVEKLKIKDIDLSVILGNLIDNAIEASEKEEQPDILINIRQKKGFLIINTSNKFTEKLTNSTSKSEEVFHGIGLESVKKTVKEYGGEFKIYQEDGYVHTSVILQN